MCTHSAVLPKHRRLCCGLPGSVWAGVIKYSQCGRMSSEDTAQLPALLVSVSLYLVCCCMALPTGWTAKAPCPERPSWVPTSCVTTGPPLPHRHHGDSHLAFHVVGNSPGPNVGVGIMPSLFPWHQPVRPPPPIWELGDNPLGTQE